MKKEIVFVLFLVGLFSNSNYGQQNSLLAELQNGEKEAVEAIALYPEKERSAILEASVYPEILVRMQNIRRNTELKFQSILSDLSKENQKKLYDLSRYPELISLMCLEGKKKSGPDMTELLSDYPDELYESAQYVNKKLFSTLQKVDQLQRESESAFNELIVNYPQKTQQAYEQLIALPEVLGTLNEYMNITVLLGDIYKNNPEELKTELDSLNIIIAEQKAKELADWKQSLEENPKAMAEYEESVKEFSDEQGYNNDAYTEPAQVNYSTEVYVHHVWRPYSYWFGPPWWYYYDYWYPYPSWYHCGYYYGPSNLVVFVGLPSYYFVDWHMHHYHHFYHYPHFTDHVINYYYGHRSSVTSITRVTEKWIRENESEIPEGWLSNDGKRKDRIKEFGKFKMDYTAANSAIDHKELTQREYLQKNAKSYPSLSRVLKDKQNPIYGNPQKESKSVPKKSAPSVQKEYKPPVKQSNDGVIKKTYPPKKVDGARDYHNESWKKTREQPRKTQVPTQKKNVPLKKPSPNTKVPVQQGPQKKPVKQSPKKVRK